MLNYPGFFYSNNNYGHAQRSFVIQVPANQDHDQRPLELITIIVSFSYVKRRNILLKPAVKM